MDKRYYKLQRKRNSIKQIPVYSKQVQIVFSSQIRIVIVRFIFCFHFISIRNFPNVNIQLPQSFNGTICIVQQFEKLILRTDARTSIAINETLLVKPDDWIQLRTEDRIVSGSWRLQIQFYLDPKFTTQPSVNPPSIFHVEEEITPVSGEIPSLPFDIVEDQLSSSTSSSLDISKEIAKQNKEEHNHPIFDNPDEEGIDIDDFSTPAPEEPDLAVELTKLSIPDSPKAKQKKPTKQLKKSNTTKKITQPKSVDSPNFALKIIYPGASGKTKSTEEKIVKVPKQYLSNELDVDGIDIDLELSSSSEEIDNENDYSTSNLIVRKKLEHSSISSKPKKVPVKKNQTPKKPTSNSNSKPKPQTPKKVVNTKPRSQTPQMKKKIVSPKKPRHSTMARFNSRAETPSRQNPSRFSKGRILTEDEKSRLSKESNAQLRRMIGEKKSDW